MCTDGCLLPFNQILSITMTRVQQVALLILLIVSQVCSGSDCNIGKTVMVDGGEYVSVIDTICYLQTCIGGEVNVRQIGCANDQKECLPAGATYYITGCQLNVCTKLFKDGEWNYVHTPKAQYCVDYYSKCRRTSETFIFMLNTKLYKNCNCKVDGLNLHEYRCRPEP